MRAITHRGQSSAVHVGRRYDQCDSAADNDHDDDNDGANRRERAMHALRDDRSRRRRQRRMFVTPFANRMSDRPDTFAGCTVHLLNTDYAITLKEAQTKRSGYDGGGYFTFPSNSARVQAALGAHAG